MKFLTCERLADTSKQENATLRSSLNIVIPIVYDPEWKFITFSKVIEEQQ